jgi:predicted deacylase
MGFVWNGSAVPAGTSACFEVPVCVMASGYRLTIPVHVVAGRRPGPVVLIAAGSHGEEVWSAEFVRRVHAFLVASDYAFAGTMLLAPVLNPHSFETGHRNTPIDLHNLNRVFPGLERGWFSDILAKALADHLLPKADIILDYHGGGSDTLIHYTYTVPPTSDRNRQIHEMALASGAEVLWEHIESRGTLSNYGEQLGKLCVVPEIGGGSLLTDPSYFEKGVADLVNMLRLVEVFDGQVQPSVCRVVVRKGGSVKPAHGGMYLPVVGAEFLGKSVPGGTVLGQVVSPYTFELLDELVAPYAKTELMQIRDRISKVHPGEYAFIIGDGDSGYTR